MSEAHLIRNAAGRVVMVLVERPCNDCGEMDLRDIRKKRCARCDRRAHVEQTMRYRRSPMGRAKYRESHLQPKWKIYGANWADRNKERIREYNRRRYDPKRRTGTVIKCAVLGCKGTFVRTGHNGAQIYGDDCACRVENRQYRHALLRSQRQRARQRREQLPRAA